jgi:hypothetical protein
MHASQQRDPTIPFALAWRKADERIGDHSIAPVQACRCTIVPDPPGPLATASAT